MTFKFVSSLGRPEFKFNNIDISDICSKKNTNSELLHLCTVSNVYIALCLVNLIHPGRDA
jgi:hypothetical protein